MVMEREPVTRLPPQRVGPRDGQERGLRAIWSELLEHREFGIHDNFFDVGGSSIEAIRLQDRIRAHFGYELSLAALLSSPTISAIAVLLRGSATSRPNVLVPFRATGAKPPLFCVHPLGGSVAGYAPLAHALGADQPVYGIQALGLDPGREPQSSMDELVATYTEAIRSVQPRGPHRLLGYSLGGMIAFACAQALRDVPGGPPLVVLLDSGAHLHRDDLLPYRAVGSYALKLDLDYESMRDFGRDDALAIIHDAGTRAGVFGPGFPRERLGSILDTAQANLEAVDGYRFGPYPGELVVLAAQHRDSADLGWSAYASALTCYAVGLPHTLLLEDKGARRVAALLARHLDGRGEERKAS